MLVRLREDLLWINFDTTMGHATGTGIFRLATSVGVSWKAHGVFTNLDDPKGFPAKTGFLQTPEPNQAEIRKNFSMKSPARSLSGGARVALMSVYV